MSLKSRIIVLNVIFLSFAALFLALASVGMLLMKERIYDIVRRDIPLARRIESLIRHQLEQSMYFEQAFRYAQTGDGAKIDRLRAEYDRMDRVAAEELALAGKIVEADIETLRDESQRTRHAEMIARLKAVAGEHDEYENEARRIFTLLAKRETGDIETLAERVDAGRVALHGELRAILANLDALTEKSMTDAERSASDAIVLLVAFASIILAVSAAVSFFISRGITGPIANLIRATGEIGSGRRDITIPIGRNDEIGRLAVSFNRMIASLAETTVSRDYLSLIIESMNDCLLVFDGDSRVKIANRAALELLEYTRAGIAGRTADTVVERSLPARDYPLLSNAEKSAEGFLITSDSRKIPVLISVSVMNGDTDASKGSICVCKDITERKEQEERIRSLSLELLKAQEAERQKIAKDLHDSVNQTLLAAKINLEAFIRDSEKYADRFEAGLEYIDRANRELKEVYTGLYPSMLTDFGLAETVRWHARNYLEVSGISAGLSVRTIGKIPHDIEVAAYRIIQEAFSNIVKHSKADKVSVRIEESEGGSLTITIEDNGIGISERANGAAGTGLGLVSMAQRASLFGGSFLVRRAEKGGTILVLEFPRVTGLDR